MGSGRPLETRGKLTVMHVYQRRNPEPEQLLQNSLQCFDSVRASMKDHGSVIPANAVFMTITDHNDILMYATSARIYLIVASPAFDALFYSACCLVDIVSAEDLRSAIQ